MAVAYGGYYSKTTDSELQRLATNYAESALPMPAGATFESAYAYDAAKNTRQEARRHLEMVRAEIAYRERNPGAREREAAANALFFGTPGRRVA